MTRRARWLALAVALCGMALVSCGSLPTLTPDLARSPDTVPRLLGAGGPMSATQSKAVLDALKARSPDTDIFDRHLALEEAIVGSPLTTGASGPTTS